MKLNLSRRGPYVFFMKTMFRRMGSYCKKAGEEAMKVNRSLCTEIYKLINNINSMYMNHFFKLRKTSRAVRSNYRLNLDVATINQVSSGDKSLRAMGLNCGICSLFT